MEAVNNFELIRPLLTWDNDDEYYYCQVIERKKDGTTKYGNKNNDSRLVAPYIIRNMEEYDNYMPRIIKICEATGARAGITLNKKSETKMAKQMLLNVAQRVVSGQFNSINALTSRLNGRSYTSVNTDKWIIDVDNNDHLYDVYGILKHLRVKHKQGRETTIHAVLPTYTGAHIVTSKFDSKMFMDRVTDKKLDISIHKNNPVALYYPSKS